MVTFDFPESMGLAPSSRLQWLPDWQDGLSALQRAGLPAPPEQYTFVTFLGSSHREPMAINSDMSHIA